MYAITGITGKVGGIVAATLLDAGLPVRAVVRDAAKGNIWAARGCDIAVASADDADAMARAFTGANGVFFMTPPNYDPKPGFPESVRIVDAVTAAIERAQPDKLVYLSTVGAHVEEPNLLNNAKLTEEGLRKSTVPVALLRAAWFMENAAWDVEAAKAGALSNFLQPADHPIPMVATRDIGRIAAALLQETWSGTRIVELEGPQRYCANDVAAGFAKALKQSVLLADVPRERWESIFRSHGMQHPLSRMRMLDGFNEGWIDFQRTGTECRQGETTLDTVLQKLVGAG